MNTLAPLLVFAITLSCVSAQTLLYLPLDERYTTRDAFLNLALLGPWVSCFIIFCGCLSANTHSML